MDLKAAHYDTVEPHGRKVVNTDLSIQFPHGTYGRIAPQSGLLINNCIDIGAGVIDADYRGNIGIVIINHSDVDFIVEKGARIAQLICTKIEYPIVCEVNELDTSSRGISGFGST